MKYAHILSYVASTPWAILEEKWAEIQTVLSLRAAGGEVPHAEIEAIVAGKRPASESRSGAVAILPIRGVIAHRLSAMAESSGGMSAETLTQAFTAVMADASVGSVVLDVDSPGGTVPGIQEAHAAMLKAKQDAGKPVIALANSLMASAAYWLSSVADEIVAIPSATVGSIGVFTVHQDLSKALAQEGIDVTVLSAGKYKTEGLPFGPLSDEAKAQIQGRVDEAYASFVKAVATGRGVAMSAVREGYGQGRALGAKAALEAGLIDSIGTMDEVVSRLMSGKPAKRLGMVAATPTDDPDRLRRLERF